MEMFLNIFLERYVFSIVVASVQVYHCDAKM